MDRESDRKALSTRLIHAAKGQSSGFQSLAVPTHRGSTVQFPTVGDLDHPREGQYRYGLHGTPTHRALIERLSRQGLLRVEGSRLAPTLEGLAIADSLARDFDVSRS